MLCFSLSSRLRPVPGFAFLLLLCLLLWSVSLFLSCFRPFLISRIRFLHLVLCFGLLVPGSWSLSCRSLSVGALLGHWLLGVFSLFSQWCLSVFSLFFQHVIFVNLLCQYIDFGFQISDFICVFFLSLIYGLVGLVLETLFQFPVFLF